VSFNGTLLTLCAPRVGIGPLARPAKIRALLVRARIDVRLRAAAARLTQFRHTHPSIIDGAGAPVAVALREAC